MDIQTKLDKIGKNKVTLTLNKPAYIGICILELSKVLMYEFHYDYIKNKYGDKSKLFFTGTDSLMYAMKTEDVYGDFSNNKEMFDFRDYSINSKYYDDSDKLVVGKVKDETASVVIEELVGLKPKMSSYLVNNSGDNNVNKGKQKYCCDNKSK